MAEPAWYSPVAAVYSAAESTVGGILFFLGSLGLGTFLGAWMGAGWVEWSPIWLMGIAFVSVFTWWGFVAVPVYVAGFFVMVHSESLVARAVMCGVVLVVSAGAAALLCH